MKNVIQFTALLTIALTSLTVISCAPTAPPGPPPQKPSTVKKQVTKPRVNIRNNSDRNIAVGVSGPEKRFISVPARSSRVVYLKPGVYKYAVAAKDIHTISGYKTFSSNHSYHWNFGVKKAEPGSLDVRNDSGAPDYGAGGFL